jgi:hypothetical protein
MKAEKRLEKKRIHPATSAIEPMTAAAVSLLRKKDRTLKPAQARTSPIRKHNDPTVRQNFL